MKGASMIIMMLLIVLAIPLFAVSIQGETGINLFISNGISNVELFTSNINNEEVSFSDQELIDSNVPVLAVGLKQSYLPKYTMNITVNGTHNVDHSRRLNTILGGVKRTNLRKH